MLVQFDKTSCLKHKLPFQFICCDQKCNCTARLCLKCAQEHKNKNVIENTSLNENDFYVKIQRLTQIMAKQYSYLQNYKDSPLQVGLLNRKNQESISLVNSIQLALKNDKDTIFHSIQKFNSQLIYQKQHLNKNKGASNLKYLLSIRDKQITPILPNLSSERGLQKLWYKISTAKDYCQKYDNFVTKTVQNYGKNHKQFLLALGFREQRLFKSKLNYCLSKWRGNKKIEIIKDLRLRQNSNQRKKDQSAKQRGRQVRTKSSSRKIRLFSAERSRSKTSANSANKENN